MSVDEIAFQIGVLVLALLGVWQLSEAIDKWRVLLSAGAWPQTEATLITKELTKEESTQLVNPDDHVGTPYYHEIDRNPLYNTLTTRYYYPLLRFTYLLDGTIIETNNLARYNRKFFYFNQEDAQAVLAAYPYQEPFMIAYHPQRPGEVFIGREHFPYIWTIIQTVGGLFFTLAFSITVAFILEQFGIEEPRLGERAISVYLIPLAVFISFLFRVFSSRLV